MPAPPADRGRREEGVWQWCVVRMGRWLVPFALNQNQYALRRRPSLSPLFLASSYSVAGSNNMRAKRRSVERTYYTLAATMTHSRAFPHVYRRTIFRKHVIVLSFFFLPFFSLSRKTNLGILLFFPDRASVGKMERRIKFSTLIRASNPRHVVFRSRKKRWS